MPQEAKVISFLDIMTGGVGDLTGKKARIDALLAEGHPRMSGKDDVNRIAEFAGTLSPDDVIVELGPWLGFLSLELAKYGVLHVVDNFVWTSDHDRRVPDILEPGSDFRPLFLDLMARNDVTVEAHKSEFEYFDWSGPEISLLLIDSPKTAQALQTCLSSVIKSLKPGALVLIKNGLNPKHHDMMSYLLRLTAEGLFTYADDNAGSGSNILALRTAEDRPVTRQQLVDLLEAGGKSAAVVQEGSNLPDAYHVAAMAKLVEAGDWSGAYALLADLEADPAIIRLWESMEHTIKTDVIDLYDLAMFSEILTYQMSADDDFAEEQDLTSGPIAAVRSFWMANEDKPWRNASFKPAVLYRASLFGYMSWPHKIRDQLPGKDIVDIGCGSGLHGIGYLALGANSVLGLDPSARTDRDRVKNHVTKKKEAFGWSPAELSAMIQPWDLRPLAVEDLETDRTFDLAIMHDTIAHANNVDECLFHVATLLRPGGRLILRHKNFYSWNGHSQKPKTVSQINMDDPDQANLVDWNHLTWDAPADHYIKRSLNRITLDELTKAISSYFDIETFEESLSAPNTGLGRLTPEIAARHPHLTERDFNTHYIQCTARVK